MGQNAAGQRFRSRRARLTAGRDRILDGRVGLIVAGVLLLIISAWSYWPTMADLFKEWQRDEDYSAGQLVPLVALFLVWRERKALAGCRLAPCWWGGIALLALAQSARTYGLLFMFESAQRYSLPLTVAALVLLVAGWQVFRRLSWILLFLFLMVPLPGRIHNMIGGPMQNLATTGSVFLLEAFGVHVSQQGNVVTLNRTTPLAVAEACSGLRMLTAFIIVAGFIAYMIKRPRWQKSVLVFSSIPVGVVCNLVRIFVTAVLMLVVSTEVGNKFFHDFAGLVMMPVAVLIIFGQIWLMDLLVVPDTGPEPKQGQVIVSARSAGRTAARLSQGKS